MSHLESVPLWVAIPVALLIVLGSGLTLLGAIGLTRLGSFYDRLHAPTLGTSWGTLGIALASAILFTSLEQRPIIHELLIALFVTITTPVTLMLLGRAALHRDRMEGSPHVPATAAYQADDQAPRVQAQPATPDPGTAYPAMDRPGIMPNR